VGHKAIEAYEAAGKTTASSRELEAAALFKAARQLEAVRSDWGSPTRKESLNEALKYNQQLWTFFQSELSLPDHEMLTELRVNLLRLSAFVDRRTFEIMAAPEPTPEQLQILIDINRNVAAGLSEKPGNPAQ
jgi:flagellar protein FlaF